MKPVIVLDCPIYPVSESDCEHMVVNFLREHKSGYTIAINAEKLLAFKRDVMMRNLIHEALLPYPDGIMAVWGVKMLHGLRCEKVDMPSLMLKVALQEQKRVAIIGATESVHLSAIARIRGLYPKLDIVCSEHGYESENAILDSIRKSAPEMVLLCLGTPKQEMFASQIMKIHSCIIFGGGGALDIFSQKKKRAPLRVQRLGLEWLWRLFQDPSQQRLRRQLRLPLVGLLIFLERLKRGRKL
jgi:N-acetylglucosaminyldiphosphoundecaprenol N-acetyl-beta-D-mannosaminyltransferase